MFYSITQLLVENQYIQPTVATIVLFIGFCTFLKSTYNNKQTEYHMSNGESIKYVSESCDESNKIIYNLRNRIIYAE